MSPSSASAFEKTCSEQSPVTGASAERGPLERVSEQGSGGATEGSEGPRNLV
jgi:hypothetical protein